MAERQRNAESDSPIVDAAREVGTLLLGVAVASGGLYAAIGWLHRFSLLESTGIVTWMQIAVLIPFGGILIGGIVNEVRKARSRIASDRVTDAFKSFSNVEQASATDVAAAVQGPKIDQGQLLRLVEQRRQQLLIDDAAFSKDVGELIVKFLQPLPRNAKRVLNRFRVTILIANQRGLFTGEKKVTRQQVGKWLVLAERWPLLRLSLSMAPERMHLLEQQSRERNPADFWDSIKSLAPLYGGDEDLREFVSSDPSLADVLERLVHYGLESAPPPTAAA